MLSMRHKYGLPAMLALLLVLLFLGNIAKAENGLPGIFLLQMRGHFILSFRVGYMLYSPSFDNSVHLCMEHGGVPASDPNFEYTNAISLQLMDHQNVTGTSFYTGTDAEPSQLNPNRCYKIVGNSDYNGTNCFYRWVYGFYDLFSHLGEPGTAFWEGLYMLDVEPEKAVLNNYEQYHWNSTHRYPYGKFRMINGLDASSGILYRADCDNFPSGCANPEEMFVVVCEVQLYPMSQAIPIKPLQPIFVQGWDDLTWAQEHWFLIYIICLTIVLLIFVITAAYCWITSRMKPTGKPITAMVIRECQSSPFAVDVENALAGEHIRFSLNHWDAVNGDSGFCEGHMGYNSVVPPVDPDEESYRNPLVLEAPDVEQYGDADCYAGKGLKKKKKSDRGMELSGPQELNASPHAKNANSSTALRGQGSQRNLASQSSRHARSTTSSSCIFSEVDMPSAGEVHEANVKL